jgi:hypothetical protein
MVNTDPRKMFLEDLADLMEQYNVTSIVAVSTNGGDPHLEMDVHDGHSPMEPIVFDWGILHPFEFRNKGDSL